MKEIAPLKMKTQVSTSSNELPMIFFETAKAWETWLEQNHATSKGLWLRLYKKDSGVVSVVYDEALDSVLCYGWIDSQLKRYDDKSYLQRFTPRNARSMWSKSNIERVARLKKEGRMKPGGLKQVKSAKDDGRWERAYDSPSKMQVPKDFLQELSKNKKAMAFFRKLSKTNTYAIAWRLQTAANPESRNRRIKEILGMLAAGKTFH